ncbi:probable flavin-containing monoamine oxidase A isoform X2 [Cryptotermes secundus]|uniref:probable flavin-containing monoamine oxidase A isoform X2 n=1 Tax=Cryptotermes secundus TaxID=105785 RepID=UPI000CD7C0EC|nr:probable flavin-containing monoamine oxidase A isoform X2 [Cryptotermes secundus]
MDSVAVSEDVQWCAGGLYQDDRVGGRTLTVPLKTSNLLTEQFDLGGQWVSSSQPHILRLLQELNLHTYPQYSAGCKVVLAGATVFEKYSSSFPYFGSFYSCYELRQFVLKIEQMLSKVTIVDPLKCIFAEELDSITMETLLLRHLSTKAAQDIVRAAIRSTFGTEASQLSALYVIALSNGTHGLLNQFSASATGARELRIKGGAQQIALKLSAQIGNKLIILNTPVTEIEQSESGVQVTTQSGQVHRSKYIVVALPPSEVLRILFSPPLPLKHRQLLQRYPVGHLTKFVITYPKAFWREKGFSGEVFSCGGHEAEHICDGGPISAAYDATTHDGQPAIAGYMASKTGIEWSSKDPCHRKQSVLQTLSEFWGDWVHDPIDYVEKNWSDETYVGGCPMHGTSPGVMGWFHHIRASFGRIYWAGTETATQWCGYMDGAVQAGERSALEVLRELRPEIVTAADLQAINLILRSSSPVHVLPVSHVYRWTLCLPLVLIAMGWTAYALRRHFWVVGVGRIA